MNTTLPTPEEATKQLATVDGEIKTIIQAANDLKVTNDAENQHASTFLVDLKGELKRLEDMRKSLTTGLNDSLKKINNSFKLRSDPLKKADQIVKGKVATYLDEVRKKAEAEKKKQEEEAQKKIDEAKKSGDEEQIKAAEKEAEKEVEAAPTSVRTEGGLVSSKQVWDFEIEDKTKVPEEYKIVNEKLVRKQITEGQRNIPGLKIFQKTQIATRA